jgi:hypothetical protein
MIKSWGPSFFEIFNKLKIYLGTHKKTTLLAVVIFGILLTVIITFSVKDNEVLPKEPFSETTCVCVFDLDKTITCGYEQAASAVKECKKRNCKLAINTARPVPYYADVKYDKLGFEKSDIENDIYHGDWIEGLVSTLSLNQLSDTIAKKKSDHLKTIQEKYNVGNRKRVILLDDVHENVTEARKNGFSAIHANSPNCGLNQHVASDIAKILDF